MEEHNILIIFSFSNCINKYISEENNEIVQKSIMEGDYQTLFQDLVHNLPQNVIEECIKYLDNLIFNNDSIENFPVLSQSSQENLEKDIGESNSRFLGDKNEQNTTPRLLKQGSSVSFLIILIIIICIPFGIIGIRKYLKKRQLKNQNKPQTKVEKLKFLPRITVQSEDFSAGENKKGLTVEIPKKFAKKHKKGGSPKTLSPTSRTAHALKLEENQQSSVINDNIFTNIDNSPKSLDDNSVASSARETPKNLNFNIEFSMIEQDSRIKSARERE